MEIVDGRVDNYGYLTFTISNMNNVSSNIGESEGSPLSFLYPSDNIPMSRKNEENANFSFTLKETFFAQNCKKNKNGTRNLSLNGKDLQLKIGRRFQNWDFPYLAIFLSRNTNITTLQLTSNEIGSAGFISIIDYIITHDHILELDLQNNQVEDPGIKYMYNKSEKLKLQVLRLSGNKIGVKSSKTIALAIVRNHYIRHLDVAAIDQNEASLIYFTTILRSDQKHFNDTLKILNLNRPNPKCPYSKLNSSHIAAAIGSMLRHNVSLEELHLQKFDFSCHDIEEMIENAKHNRTLKVIDLCCNDIGDFGAELFSTWLEKRPSLRSLLLGHNNISNHGIRTLSKGIKLSKLLMIDVSFNRFDDEGGIELFKSFKKTPLMERIRIFGNKLEHETAKIVERLLLANVLNQENIDVKPYKVHETFHLAYYQGENLK